MYSQRHTSIYTFLNNTALLKRNIYDTYYFAYKNAYSTLFPQLYVNLHINDFWGIAIYWMKYDTPAPFYL